MKQKLAAVAKQDIVNLASSGAKIAFADQWQSGVLENHVELTRRAAESHQFGLASLKHAIRAAFGVPAERQIVITSGASGGIRLVCEVLLAGRKDDEVFVETPAYEPLRAVPQRLGATVVPLERRELSSIARSVTDQTVALFLTNLHNPTGDWLTYDELRKSCEALDAVGSRAVIVVDETFLDLGPLPGTTAATLHPRVVTLSSLSKSHGLPALRCGWVTADAATLPRFVEDAVLFQNIGCQLAEVLGAMALEKISDFRDVARRQVAQNQAAVSQWLRDMAAAEIIVPHDAPLGCVVFPRVLNCGSTMRIGEELESRFGVLVAPGQFFGAAHDDCIRIGFGGSCDDVSRGLSRLADGLRTLRKKPT